MLDVLEHSGLLENVMKFRDNKLVFTEDKTGVKITGIYGKKGALEVETYKNLEKDHLEKEKGFKIFMFHSLLKELKPKNFPIEGHALNLLPKNFNYYAGGHPHFTAAKEYPGYGIISYPGPIFPNNFKELEELKQGSFCIVESNNEINIKNIPLEIKKVHSYNINANNKTTSEIQKEINDIEKKDGIVYLQGIDVIINDRFYFNRAHDGKRMAVLKSDGQIIVTGTLTENSNYSPKSDDEFLIYDNSKTKVILAINLESGNIYIRGTLYPYEHEISASENDVIRFNDEYGSTAIKIDNSGNLYLKIDIVQNGVPN